MTSPTRTARSAGRAVRRTGHRHAELITCLTVLKNRCRLTFAALAERTAVLGDTAAVSASTLKRAVDQRTVPQEHVVLTFVRACGADLEEERTAVKLWRAARAEHRGILATLRAPTVTSIRTRADLAAALAAAYERAGAPPLRALQDRATTDDTPGDVLLPLTTAWRITRREGRPTSWTQCEAFLRGCGIHPRRMRQWHDAWKRTHAVTPTDRAAVTDVRRTARGAADTGARHDVARLAAGIKPVVEAIAADTGIRNAPTALAASVQVVAEAIAVMQRSASREAHRNGTTPPGWITATKLLTHGINLDAEGPFDLIRHPAHDHGIDLITRTPDGHTAVYEFKSQHRPGPPPEALPTHTTHPPPPPRPAPAARTT